MTLTPQFRASLSTCALLCPHARCLFALGYASLAAVHGLLMAQYTGLSTCPETRSQQMLTVTHDVQKGLRVHQPNSATVRPSMRTCSVCFQAFSPDAENVTLPCGHDSTCARCWGLYIMSKLEEGQAAHIQCTEPGCSMPVPLAEAKRVLPSSWCAFKSATCLLQHTLPRRAAVEPQIAAARHRRRVIGNAKQNQSEPFL
jgi:hypothetical protein